LERLLLDPALGCPGVALLVQRVHPCHGPQPTATRPMNRPRAGDDTRLRSRRRPHVEQARPKLVGTPPSSIGPSLS
jgi:hypothetical protein